MEKNSYARLLSFANTRLGKLVSVVVAIAMVCTLTSAVYAASEAIEAWADNEGSEAQDQGMPDYANANFVTQNCVIELGGQQVAGSVAVTPGADLVFSVIPAEGYQVSVVNASDSFGSLPVDMGMDQCVIWGDFVYGDLHIEAIAAVDPDNPQDDTPDTPIGEDTTIDDGQVIPDPILAAPVILLSDATRTYNATPLASVDYTVEGLAEGDRMEVFFEGGQTDVGQSTVSVSGYVIWRGEKDVTALYQQAALPSATVTVEPAPLVITTPSASKPFDGEPLVYEGSFEEGDIATVAELWGSDTVEFVVTGSQTDVGTSPNTYTLTWTSGDPNNYVIASENIGTLTVTPSEEFVYVIAPSGSKTYDGEPFDGGSITWTGLPEGYTVLASCEGAIVDAGKSTTHVLEDTVRIYDEVGVDVTENYKMAFINGEVVVEPAPLSVYTESAFKTMTEGDDRPLTASGTIAGFVNGETATFTVTGSQNGVGSSTNTYVIEWDGTAKQSNYQVFEELGMLNVFEEAIETAEGDNTTGRPGATGNTTGGSTSPTSGTQAQPTGNSAAAPVVEVIEIQPSGSIPPAVSLAYPADTYAQATTQSAPAVSASTGGTGSSGSGSASSSSAGTSSASSSSSTSGSSEGSGSSANAELNPVVEAVATGMQNLEQVVIGDEPTPLAAPNAVEEVVADDETPLGVFDEPVDCWVHWYTILGLIATAVYAAVVMFFRRAYSYELESREAAVLGVPASVVQPQVPASSGGKAGKEA